MRTREEVTQGITAEHFLGFADGALRPAAELGDGDLADLPPSLAHLFHSGRDAPAEALRDAASALRRLGWLTPEPAAEPGHLRFPPAGMVAYRTLRDWLEEWVRLRVGGEEVRTPLFFDWAGEGNAVRELAETFHDRLYFAGAHGEVGNLMLRYSADPGLFSMLRGARLAARQLPLRLWEFLDAYRRDRSGEIRDVSRARAFSFVDHHTLCAEEAEGVEEYIRLLEEQLALAASIGHPSAVQMTMTRRAHAAYPELAAVAARASGAPIFLELIDDERHYWSVKHHLRDPAGVKTFNLQLDLRNAARFGISVRTRGGELAEPVVVHGSTASIERWMLVFTLAALRSGEAPAHPLWLAPAQVRILPAAERHEDESVRLAARLSEQGVRVQVDDRSRPVRWRVGAAGREWIPFVAVIGDRETGGSLLRIRDRSGRQSEMTAEALCAQVRQETAGFPRRHLAPALLSRRLTLQ